MHRFQLQALLNSSSYKTSDLDDELQAYLMNHDLTWHPRVREKRYRI